MSVVVDYEERVHYQAHADFLTKMFAPPTVSYLLDLRSPRHYHLLARVSGVLLGSLVAASLDGPNDGIVQVLAIAVHPRQRHHHIAMGLLKAVVEEARREHRHHVITIGSSGRLQAAGWHVIEDLSPNLFPVDGYQETDLPLQRWMSIPTRSFMPRPLRRIPDAAQMERHGLIVLPNRYPTARPLPPLSR